MTDKKKSKDYPYYTMKIPLELKELFEKYIRKYKNLGFKSVSQYALYILQQEGMRILKENKDLIKDSED